MSALSLILQALGWPWQCAFIFRWWSFVLAETVAFPHHTDFVLAVILFGEDIPVNKRMRKLYLLYFIVVPL